MSPSRSLSAISILLALAGCGVAPYTPSDHGSLAESRMGQDVAMYALMLLQTGYRFGGKNPEAGLDCSGMVSYVYQQAAGLSLQGNAASLASQGREVRRKDLRAGDLVFFNTLGRPFSHVGIYLGRDEFIHAPNSQGRVRVDKMSNAYYASRYEGGRTLLD